MKSKPEGRKAINVSIAPALHAKFTEACDKRGVGYSEVLVDCVRAWLNLLNKCECYDVPQLVFKTVQEIAKSECQPVNFPTCPARMVKPQEGRLTVGSIGKIRK